MPAKNLTDAEIIGGLRQPGHERRAYEDALYTRFAYFIDEGQKKFSLTEEDTFSCYSDSVIKALENITNGSFEGRSSLKTYLFQIFHNKCVDQVRKNTTKKSEVHQAIGISDILYTMSDSAKTIIQKLSERADIDDLKSRLNQLGENCRQMLLMSADGYSDKEIAVVMNFKTAGVAKTSRLRCMEKLRRFYFNRT